MAPSKDWEVFWYDGEGGFGLDPKDAVSAEVTLEMAEVAGDWFVDDKPKVA